VAPVTDLLTFRDGWTPRADAWLEHEPSAFAGAPNRPLFIGACPRSGTTLLRSMLDNHPDMAVPAETDFVIPVWVKRGKYGNLAADGNRRRLAEWIFNTPGHGGQRIRAGVDRDEAIARVSSAAPTLGSILAECFRMYAGVHGKPRWGDKRPAYANYIPMLFELFPDAQFIHVVRDPRAVVASLMRIDFFPGDDELEAGTAMYEATIRNVDRSARRLRPDQFLDVRYEDMVRDPAGALRRVCEFAGLRGGDAIDEMIAGERGGKFREGWHDRLAEPVTSVHVDSWREYLESREVALVEHALRRQMERFGYEPSPGLESAPDPAALRELARQRRRRSRRWRRFLAGELKRRVTYRRPVAVEDLGAGSGSAG
jgi:hypothetical protein